MEEEKKKISNLNLIFLKGQVGKLNGRHRFARVFQALIKSVVKSQNFSRNQGRVGTVDMNSVHKRCCFVYRLCMSHHFKYEHK